MKRIIKENSDKDRISDEKINSIDNLINLYKKTNEDLNLEIDKIKLARKLEKEESNKIIEDFEKTLKEKDLIFENEAEKLKNKYQQDLEEQLEENENLKFKYTEFKMERDKYKGELDIALDENKSLSNQINEQNFKFNEMLKEREEYYMKQINNLNQRLRSNMVQRIEENNEFNDENNYFYNNIINEKLVKNGEKFIMN